MSATTPHRADMSAQTPSKATHRRVLGDLPAKALNTPSKHSHALNASEVMRAQSPLKQVTTLSPQVRIDKENMISTSTFAQGRKRSIYEVDDAENVEMPKAMFGARDQPELGPRADLTAAAMRSYAEMATVDLDPPGSPTERNTPSPEPEEQHALDNSQDTQGSQFSISKYFDLNGAGASQPEPIEEEQLPVEEEKKQKSKAELLRTRLRFGYYKLETNQVAKRGSEVISTWESLCASSSDASTALPLTSSTESAASHGAPNTMLSPARRDTRPVFVKANLDPFRPIGKLTPAPVLLPTAVSSRMNYEYQINSSPPQAVSPEQLMSPVRQLESYRTPASKRIRVEGAVEETAQGRLQSRFQEGDLTSSAVKGNAANGLLKLSHGMR